MKKVGDLRRQSCTNVSPMQMPQGLLECPSEFRFKEQDLDVNPFGDMEPCARGFVNS